jgi:hypothetical protein
MIDGVMNRSHCSNSEKSIMMRTHILKSGAAQTRLHSAMRNGQLTGARN